MPQGELEKGGSPRKASQREKKIKNKRKKETEVTEKRSKMNDEEI